MVSLSVGLNGNGLDAAVRWAILYARVSTEEQARRGYSIRQQLERGREWCAANGYEVLAEITDEGYSGASLARPGMDDIRDRVVAGDPPVALVLAQDRDRFAREPAYHYLLRREFEEHGTVIRALNDRGDGSPEGELTDGILDQLGKYERAKIAERSRRGKIRKAREGKVMAGHRVKYGFALNAARDGLLIDEEKMRHVRRIFRMVGTEGQTLQAVYRAFQAEGIPTPGGGERWDRTFFRLAILDDAYRPHTFEEAAERVAPDVAARLDRDALYGLWTFNRLHTRTKQVSEPTENGGRRYRKQVKTRERPEEERLYVPVPYAGIPRGVVDAARDAIKDNRRPSNAGRRFWELSGGILRCGVCRMGTETQSVKARSGDRYHHYYACRTRHKHGAAACSHRGNHRAVDVEGAVWDLIAALLKDRERLRAGLDEMIETERRAMRGNPEAEAKAWLDKLSAVDRKRARFQDMAAEGHITFAELGAKLAALDDERATAERELKDIETRRDRLRDLERDRDALLEHYARMMPEELDALSGEERHQVYRMLRLRAYIHPDGGLDVEGILSEAVQTPADVCTDTGTRSVYPRANQALYGQVRAAGAVVSEYFLGEPPLPWRFPARNRVIAGLCDATVVVEAPEKSGALITARHALDAGRDVWAVPGPPDTSACRGSNRLLADGAGVLWDVTEFVDAVAGGGRAEVRGSAGAENQSPLPEVPVELPEEEAEVLGGVESRAAGADVVSARSGVEMRRVLSALALLELKGYVARDASGNFARRIAR